MLFWKKNVIYEQMSWDEIQNGMSIDTKAEVIVNND
jgi:hypothetical protein